MTAPLPSAEPFSDSSEPVSVAVSEHIAARRLGVSVDMLRRDRRTGKLGIPFIKLGEGKRGLVRYDLADLEKFIESQKRVGRAVASQARPPVVEPAVAEQPASLPEQPVEPVPEPEPEMPRPRPRSPWDALADADDADPFAAAGRTAARRQGSGYWGH
jgi:hypothetical protein